MHPRSGRAIRPLLDCRRFELRAFLAERGLSFVEDSTNDDVSIPRNRVRGELIPFLQERFNPAVVDALANQAELARDEWLWMLDELSSRNIEGAIWNAQAESWTLDRVVLMALPRALRRVLLWRSMNDAAGGRTVSLQHVNAVMRMVESAANNGCVDAPGHFVERIADHIVLRTGRSRDVRIQAPTDSFRYTLPLPGEVSIPEHGCIVSAQLGEPDEAPSARMRSGATAVISHEGWTGPLSVRNRRPGDRFRPFGLRGQKKLQDFLVDRKVARADRDRVPLVVDAHDRILWVAGYEIDEAFRVIDASQAVLILTLRHV
jgi:tRNA(Ile)-lysidine synthase